MNDGSQPSLRRPTRRSSDGAMPPSHTSSGFWMGLGCTPMPSRWKSGPSWSTASSVQRRRMSGSASSNHAARAPRSMPNACCSCASATPRPNAGSSRPPDMRSRLAIDFATEHRVAAGQHHHAGAELQLLGAAGGVGHADDGIGRLAADPLGEPQESKRNRSRSSTNGPKRSSFVSDRVPSPKPIRTFMS